MNYTQNNSVVAAIDGGPTDNLADDLLRGAEAIAQFLFGDKTLRRKVYHLAETSRLKALSFFSVGWAGSPEIKYQCICIGIITYK